MLQLKWEYTVALFFVACSVLIVIFIFLQASYSEHNQAQLLREISQVQSTGFTLQEVPSTKLTKHVLSDYHEILERPLFFTERKPIILAEIDEAEAEQAKAQAVPTKNLVQILIGIINTPAGVYALFHNSRAKPDEAKFLHLQQGQEVDGWYIKEIKSDRVLVSADNKDDEILLVKPRVRSKASKARKARSARKARTNPFKQKLKK